MRPLRTTFVALLMFLGLVCATQTNAQSRGYHGYYREWHNAAGQVIGYQYRSCSGQIDSWGVTTGPPTINQSLDCGVINQRTPTDGSLVPVFCGPSSVVFPPICIVTNPH